MNKIFTITGIIILILIIVFAIFGTDWLLGGSDNGNRDPNNGDSNGALDDTYSSNRLDFSIKHNSQAEITTEGESSIKFLFTGDEQPDNTEVQDGYVFTVTANDKNGFASLTALAESRRESTLNIGEILEPISETSFQGKFALRFRSQTVGAPVTHLFIESEDWYYHISYSIAATNTSDRNQYQIEVTGMLSSFDAHGDLLGDAPVFNRVSLAFLDTEGTTTNFQRGCDRVVMVEGNIIPTTAPLTSAMRALFAEENERVTSSNWYNFIAKTNDTLSFDRATVISGTANIYLTGELSGLEGVCDNPRARIQIEETALQFSTVNDVKIFLNGMETNLTPSGQ